MGGEKVTSGFRTVAGRVRFPLWARFLTAAFVIVLSVGTATAASLLLYIEGIADDLKLDPEFVTIEDKLSRVEAGEPQTIMILGSDKRPEFKKDKFRGLSDTTMLLRVDPDRNAIALFSLPRDLKVEIPGYGTAKLNEAYANGGPELTLETIQKLTAVPATDNQGLEVNHIVNVDFEGFASAVNAIGCVYVDVDRRYYHSNDETVRGLRGDRHSARLPGAVRVQRARLRALPPHRQRRRPRRAPAGLPARGAPEGSARGHLRRSQGADRHLHRAHHLGHRQRGRHARGAEALHRGPRRPGEGGPLRGQLGPSFVTTTTAEINKAVTQFLGIEDTPGQRGETAAPEDPGSVTPEAAPDESGSTPAAGAAKAKRKKGGATAQLVESTYGKELAKSIRARKVKLPIYYPTILEAGTDYAQKPRVYKINGTGEGSPPNRERAAYKWVFSRPALGEYYGFMATRWKDPPILKNPSEEREIDGRTYKLFYDGDRLKLIAWQDDEGSFWLSNTLIQSLSDREMIDIAKGMAELPGSAAGAERAPAATRTAPAEKLS